MEIKACWQPTISLTASEVHAAAQGTVCILSCAFSEASCSPFGMIFVTIVYDWRDLVTPLYVMPGQKLIEHGVPRATACR